MSGAPRGERRIFLQQWRRNFMTTGALTSSSRSLARAITAHVVPGDAPRRILEAGPGTGVFTAEIARRMGPEDRLDVYEINQIFVDYLRRRIDEDPAFQKARGRVALHQGDILDLPDDAVYDRIVSSLPLNNFQPGEVRTIFDTLMSRLTAGGILSYFEYAFVRALKGLVSLGRERERLRGVAEVTGEYLDRFAMRSDPVLLNLPPAVAHHLVKPAELKVPSPAPGAPLRPATAVR